MQKLITSCGYRWDLCLAYKPNLERNPSTRQLLSDGWFQYFGFRIPAEQICCDGCLAEEPDLVDKSCPVRLCVIQRGVENCSLCTVYGEGCMLLAERLVVREEVEERCGIEIPTEDYQLFIRPYENKRRLVALRNRVTNHSLPRYQD